jgi:hypothetical protein
MNEELLRLAYSKLNTEASFEDFKSDFEGDENLQKLVYGKLNTEASFEDFMIDVRGTEVKKKGVSEPTATEPQSDSVTPQEVQDTSSATTQPMETQESASSNGEVEPPVEYEWKPVLDELGEQVYYTDKETGELKPAKEKVQKGFATQQEYENAKVEALEERSIGKSPSKQYKQYTQAVELNEEDNAAIDEEIQKELNGEDLTSTLKKGWNAVAKTVNAVGTFGLGDAPVFGDEVYVDERAKAKSELLKENDNNESMITPEALEERTIELVRKEKQDALKIQKNQDYLSSLPEDELKELNLEGVNNYKTIEDKMKYNITQASLLNKKSESLIRKRAMLLDRIESEEPLDIAEGTEVGTLDNGKIVPVALIKELKNVNQELTGFAEEMDNLGEDYMNNNDALGDAYEEVDYLRRVYDTGEKSKSTVMQGFGDLYVNSVYGIPLFLDEAVLDSVGLEAFTPEQKEEFIKKKTEWESAKAQTKGLYARDVEFKDLSIDNIGQFVTQEVATQIPIFAQMAMPGGVASMGATSTTDKYMQMASEEAQGKASYNKGQRLLASLGFGVSEAVLGALPTMKIMKRASKAVTNQIGRNSFNMGVKNHFLSKAKDGGVGLLKEGGTESITEGLTTVTQNFIDRYGLDKKDVNILDNVGHAMFSGGLLGGLMGGAPSLVGVAVAPFSNSKSKEQIRKNVEEIFSLQKKIDGGELDLDAKKVVELRIKSLESANDKAISKLVKSAEKISEEAFVAVKDIAKKQADIQAKAGMIMSNKTLDNETKESLLKDLKTEFDSIETRRQKIIAEGSTVLDALPDNEVIKLQDQASKELSKEAKDSGKENFTITPEQINERAIENYNKNKKENNEKEQPGTQNETTNQEGNEGTETTSTDTEQETGETEIQEEVIEPTQEVETKEETIPNFSDDSYKNATPKQKTKFVKDIITNAFKGKKLNFSAAKMKSMVNKAMELDPNNDLKTEKFVEKVKEVIAKEEAKASDTGTTKKAKEIRNSVKNGELGKVDKGNKSKINRFARLNLKDVPDSVKKKYKDAIDNIHKLTSKSKEVSKKVDFDAVSKDIDEVLSKTQEYLAEKASIQNRIDLYIDGLSNAEKKEISESKETNIKVVTDKMNLTADERQFIEDNKGSVSAYLKDSDVEVEFDGNETKKSINDSWKSDDKKTWNNREREIIRSLKDFTAIQFAALSNKEKKKLNESVQKLVESGIVDANLQDIVNKLEGDSFFDRVEGAIPKLSVGWNNLIKGISRAIESVGGDKNITMASKKASSNKIIKIDSSLKNYENNVIYKTIFAPFAKASSIYENYMNDVNARFSNFSERFKSDNDKVRVGQKATIYMVDLYKKTNPQLNIASIKSYLEDTIESLEVKKISKRTRNSLEELLKDLDFDADGNLTQKSIDKLLAEDNVKSSIDFLRKELDNNREDAYSSSLFDTKNGVGFNENYFPLVSSATRAAEDLGDMFKGGKPSVTSNNLKQLSGKPEGENIIDFDAFNTAFRSINTTQKQDKMHRPHQVAKVVFKKLKDKYNSGSKEMEMVEAIEDLYYTQIERATGSVNVGDRGLLDDVKKVALSWTYRKLLGSTEKFVVDAASNVIAANAMVGVKNFIKGDKIRTKINRITKEGDSPTLLGDVLSTLGCTQIDRFTSLRLNSNGKVELDLEGLRGRFRKSNLDPKWKESMQLLLNKSVVAGRSSKDISKTPGYLADQMIGQPDIMSGLPLWFGAFTKEFENISGKELDIDKVINKDQDYIDSIYKDIEKASNYANIKLDEFASTKNKIERKPSMHNKNIGVQAIQGSKNFMLGQTESEWTTLKKYFGNLMHNKVEGLTKKESLKVATAISARLLLYRPLMNMAKASKTVISLGAASFVLGLTGEDDLDEELDESVDYLSEMLEKQNLAKSAVSSVTDLATTAVTGIGGSYKNKAVNWTADWLYEQIKEDFDPEGNYDPDTFNKIPIKVKDLNSRTLALNAADIIVGQYAPSINSLISGKPSEILPFTGAIPLAGDISNLVKTMNKSIGKESTEIQRIYGWSLWNAMKESAKGDPALLRKRNSEAKKILEDAGIDEDVINEIKNEIEGIKDEIDTDDLRDNLDL